MSDPTYAFFKAVDSAVMDHIRLCINERRRHGVMWSDTRKMFPGTAQFALENALYWRTQLMMFRGHPAYLKLINKKRGTP